MYSYLKCIVYEKLLKPRQLFRITLYILQVLCSLRILEQTVIIFLYINWKFVVTDMEGILLSGTDWIFKYNLLRFVLQGLILEIRLMWNDSLVFVNPILKYKMEKAEDRVTLKE